METSKWMVAVVGLALVAGSAAATDADEDAARFVAQMVWRINQNLPQHTAIEHRKLTLTSATADGATVTQHYVFEDALPDDERRRLAEILGAAQAQLADGVCGSLRQTPHWQRILDLGIRYAFEYRDAADREVAFLHVDPMEC
jgi:hypothetical protein